MPSLAPTAAVSSNDLSDLRAQVEALHRSQAVIEFDPHGHVLTANQNFLHTLGYSLDEIRGCHHATFCDPSYAKTPGYRQFWASLAAGEYQSGEFRRLTKGGDEVWIQASYNPVHDEAGRIRKVVKFASDVTQMVRQRDDQRGQIAALDKSMAVIEFDLQGNVLAANQNFLRTLGYSLDEIRGRHHAMFCEPDYAKGAEYRRFWADLETGNAKSGEFRRVGKGGGVVWIQATYNPIYDSEGRLKKIVKFASDITAMVEQRRLNVRFASMNEESPICMVFADRDFVVRYVNRAAKHTLQAVQGALGISVDRFVGSKVDCLLLDPEADRARMTDGRANSVRYDLAVGSETFEVTASAVHDDRGNHLGSMLSFLVVTEKKRTERQIAATVESLTQSASTLAGTSTQMTSSANETSGQAHTVSTAADAVSQSAQSVASGISQLEVSIQEISKNSAEAARVATLAVKAADATDGTVSKLGTSSAEIGKVVKVITAIAQQTNLLALNATIEAARAGEAGKGFAVVANEVKELAKETARATEDIGRKIEAIQTDTKGAVEAIAEIRNVIGRIHDIQTTIAGAVEEQTATTNELSRTIGETARGSVEIARAIESVAEAASETSAGAAATHQSADELTGLAANLGALLRK